MSKPENGTTKSISQNGSQARLCVDYSKQETQEAIMILYDAGFEVYASPVSGISEPVLNLGSASYRGIKEIRSIAKNAKRAK